MVDCCVALFLCSQSLILFGARQKQKACSVMLRIVTVVDVATFHFSCGELFGTVVVVNIAGGR